MKAPKWFKNLLWASSFWAVTCFVLFVFADKIVMPIIAGQLKSTVELPQVEGLGQTEAETILQELGLGVIWREEGKYSSTIPEDAVLTQLPSSGREVKKGRNVILTRSLGKRRVEIPNLRGESKRQGSISLERIGVVKGPDIAGYHSSIPRGVIIRTQPQEGTLARIGDTVSLVISSGRQDGHTLLPNVTGVALEQAQSNLLSIGFELGNLIQSESKEHIAGTVIQQYPKHGEYLPKGSKINLTVTQ